MAKSHCWWLHHHRCRLRYHERYVLPQDGGPFDEPFARLCLIVPFIDAFLYVPLTLLDCSYYTDGSTVLRCTFCAQLVPFDCVAPL